MPSYLIRNTAVAAVFLAIQLTGRSQGLVNRQPPTQAYPVAVPVAPAASAYPAQERIVVVDPNKKLSAGDMVTVEIMEDREGGIQRVVTAAGAIDVVPIGRVQVAGKTTEEAAADIKRKLEADYYYHATVKLNIDRVSVVAPEVGSVMLAGEIRLVGPQKLTADEKVRLSTAILKAGGFTEWGNREKVKVTRQLNGKAVSTEYNVEKIIKSGDQNADPELQDGDRIFVPKKWFRM
jgi:protein involved in polysaccharide export with SLBB domain